MTTTKMSRCVYAYVYIYIWTLIADKRLNGIVRPMAWKITSSFMKQEYNIVQPVSDGSCKWQNCKNNTKNKEKIVRDSCSLFEMYHHG